MDVAKEEKVCMEEDKKNFNLTAFITSTSNNGVTMLRELLKEEGKGRQSWMYIH